MLNVYKKLGSLTINHYQEILSKYLIDNGEEMIDVVCLNNMVHKDGFLVALYKNESDIGHLNVTSVSNYCKNVHLQRLHTLPTDFDLPRGIMSIFRGYSWPFINFVNETHFDSFVDGNFFIECRNCQKSQLSIVSAKLPKIIKDIGNHSADLTLTYGITHCCKSNGYLIHHHTWKKDQNYNAFRKEEKNKETIEKYFCLWDKTPLSAFRFIYLNELFAEVHNETRRVPVQSSLFEPDVWWKGHISTKEDFNPIDIKPLTWKHKIKYNRKRKGSAVVRKIQDFKGCTFLYLVKVCKVALDLSKKYMLIPF